MNSAPSIHHEFLVHVPMLAHGAPHSVLVIGDGGGALTGLLNQYRAVGRIVRLLDDDARAGAGAQSSGGRIETVIASPRRYLDILAADEQFDVLLMAPEETSEGEGLFDEQFLRRCVQRLATGGVMVIDIGDPTAHQEELRATLGLFRKLFVDSTCYMAGGHAFCWATSDTELRATPEEVLARRLLAERITPAHYTPATHKQSFNLPDEIKNLLP